MTNEKRLNTIAELAAANKRGRFTPSQIAKIKQVRSSIHDAITALRTQEWALQKQTRLLQGTCPHPFRHISWKEIIPAGGIKGFCDLCGETRWFSEYPKHLTEKAKFKERVGSDGRIIELTV